MLFIPLRGFADVVLSVAYQTLRAPEFCLILRYKPSALGWFAADSRFCGVGSGGCARTTKALANLCGFEHLGHGGEFFPATSVTGAGEFGGIDSPPCRIVHPADMPLRQQLEDHRSPPSWPVRHFLRNLLGFLLSLSAIGRNCSRRASLCPSDHVQPVFDFSFYVGEYTVGRSGSAARTRFISDAGDGQLRGNFVERSVGRTKLHGAESALTEEGDGRQVEMKVNSDRSRARLVRGETT